MKRKAAIFDLDGTLACTLPDLHVCVNRMLEKMGYPQLTLEDVLRNVNSGERDYVRAALPKEYRQNEAEVSRCLAVYSALYGEHYCDQTYLYDGIGEAIAGMKSAGVWLALHTNKRHDHACGMVERLLPAGAFDCIIGDGMYPSKPDPTATFRIVKESGLRLEDFCFIGDSDVDMDTAGNAGMFSVGVIWGYRPESVLLEHGAGAIARTPSDLLKILGIA